MSKINISPNIKMNTRENRFIKKFTNYQKHPFYNKLKNLYTNDKITTVTTVNKLFNDIIYKKNGEPYKKSLKSIEKIEKINKELNNDIFKQEIEDLLPLGDIGKQYAIKDKDIFKIDQFYTQTSKNNGVLFTEKIYLFKKYINDTYNKNNELQNKKFSLTLQSANLGIKHTFKFNCYEHFVNWYNKILQEKESKFLNQDTYGLSLLRYKENPQNYKELPVNLTTNNVKKITNEYVTNEPINNSNYITDKEELKNAFDFVKVINLKFIGGGCNKHTKTDKNIKTSFYDFKLYNPVSRENNCFFKCLEYIFNDKLNIKELRKKYLLNTGEKINIDKAYEIIKDYNIKIDIIDPECNEELDNDTTYILLRDDHYYVVESYEEINRKDIKTKRGLMTFDFETRNTEEYQLIKATGLKMYILKDTICGVYYHECQKKEMKEMILTTNNTKSSARQFIDFLNNEAVYNRSYNIIAHNGGNFDFYFLISVMTDKELLECDIGMRGTTIISINYRGNLFKDSYCFLLESLSSLSEDYKIEHGKICNMILHGENISSKQLCFYRPKLMFNEFLNLETNDKEFWDLYTKYCLYDCIALSEIWEKFTICINGMIEKMNPYILNKACLMSCSTIGSHAKKIIVELNKFKGKSNCYKEKIEKFMGIEYVKVRNDKPMTEKQEWAVKNGKLDEKLFYRHEKQIDYEKYKFLCNFKRGGISHCNKAGKHMTGITGADIASQYPASLKYCYIPCGKSKFITYYDKNKKGFYHLKNVKFNSYLFKPVASYIEGESLNWTNNDIDDLYVDSYMIDYLQQNYGLISFDVVEGLVSDSHILGDKLFGLYIDTFYEEKKNQDLYKSIKGDERYNPALRKTIKLYLNSLTGKLVEEPSRHYSLKFNDENKEKIMNGQGIVKEFNTDKINDWLVAGVMIYSYSKRLLFEYIKCLPNNSDDIIHVETDGLYFSSQKTDEFIENVNNYIGDYPVKFGEDLGNLKIEERTEYGQVAYFLGKKFYTITFDDKFLTMSREEILKIEGSKEKNIYKIKGIPQKTIDEYGNDVLLVDVGLYEKIYNGETVERTFTTLKRDLFTENTKIMSYNMTRTIKPNMKYHLYE